MQRSDCFAAAIYYCYASRYKQDRDIANDTGGLRGIIQLLLNFIKLQNSDLIA